MSSYETAVEYAREQYAKKGYPFKLTVIKPFYNDPDYIQCVSIEYAALAGKRI
jgi:ferrochelatase